MSMLDAMGFDVNTILQDPQKLKTFIPVFEGLGKTFLKEGEKDFAFIGSFENGEPIIRMVALKAEDNKLIIARQINNPETGKPISINLLDLLAKAVPAVREELPKHVEGAQTDLLDQLDEETK